MKKTILLVFLLVVISTLLIAGCTTPTTKPPATTAKATAVPTPVMLTGCQQNALDKSKTVMNNITGLRGNSFCEIILWCTDPGYENTGGTYGSSGLNDPKDSCPDALLKGIDTTALALQYKVSLASTNPEDGRKFWIMDEFDIPTSTTVRDFSGLKAYYWAETPLGPDGKPQELDPTKVQYLDQIMGRSTYIIFEKGKPVYLMDDDKGTTWILKNYQTGVDPTLTMESLPTYNTHLKNLPPGWGNFREKILPEKLILSAVNGKARITWDELGGSWDALDPGVANYMP